MRTRAASLVAVVVGEGAGRGGGSLRAQLSPRRAPPRAHLPPLPAGTRTPPAPTLGRVLQAPDLLLALAQVASKVASLLEHHLVARVGRRDKLPVLRQVVLLSEARGCRGGGGGAGRSSSTAAAGQTNRWPQPARPPPPGGLRNPPPACTHRGCCAAEAAGRVGGGGGLRERDSDFAEGDLTAGWGRVGASCSRGCWTYLPRQAHESAWGGGARSGGRVARSSPPFVCACCPPASVKGGPPF